MQTGDYLHRQVSLNRKQTKPEPDGSFRIVVAAEDPGVPNWLDTEGPRLRAPLLPLHAARGRDRDAPRRAGRARRAARLAVTAIFKLCAADEWSAAVAAGEYAGSADDRRDGFLHFSTREQLAETAARHFAGQEDLVLVEVDGDRLGEALRYEPSRGGALFPHLYAALPVGAARAVTPVVWDGERHRLDGDPL